MRPTVPAIAIALMLLTTPSAQAETRTLRLPAFTGVYVSSGIDATITVGGTQSVEVESSDSKLLDQLHLRVQRDTLRAYFDFSFFDLFAFGDRHPVRLRITAPVLHDVEANSGAVVAAAGAAGEELKFVSASGAELKLTGVSGREISIEAASGASLEAEGACETGRADASSGARLDASRLLCTEMKAEAASGADLDVYASRRVEAHAASGARIQVTGGPATVEQETGSGGQISVGD